MGRFKDYKEVDSRHFDLNNNFNQRTFDINPNNIKYNNKTYDPYRQVVSLDPLPDQPKGLAPQSVPEMVGQSLLMNPTYFPTPINTIQPESAMSDSYIRMKQAQDMQSMLDNGDSNIMAIDRLKLNQANELQKNLQLQGKFAAGPQAVNFGNNQNQWAQTSNIKVINQTHAYNAQGEAVSDRTTLFQDRNNKYKMLKEMSPEMLNKLYGRQSDQSTLPPSLSIASSGDIYDQTSCFQMGNKNNNLSHGQLKGQLEARHKSIMGQKHQLGIQSFNNVLGSTGTNIDDAYANF